MRTLAAIILLSITTNVSRAEIIELSYWTEGSPYSIDLGISDTKNGLKLMYLTNQETPFSFSSNYRYRDMEGYWNGPEDFSFQFRPRYSPRSFCHALSLGRWQANGDSCQKPLVGRRSRAIDVRSESPSKISGGKAAKIETARERTANEQTSAKTY